MNTSTSSGRVWLGFLAAIILLSGCRGKDKASGSGQAHDPAADPVATIVTAKAEVGPVEEQLETFGTVEFDPHKTETVSFVSSGQVLQIMVTPGQTITRNDPLLWLGPMPSTSLEVTQARINLEYAQRKLDRIERLRARNLATNEAVQTARKDLESIKAVLAGFGLDTGQGRLSINAPFSGIVVKVLVSSGMIVHAGQEVLLLAPATGIVVRAGFEPEDAVQLQPGMSVEILPVFPAHGEDTAHAVLANLHQMVDPATQLVESFIYPQEIPVWMIAGAKVVVRIGVKSATDSLRIPREALLEKDGVTGVFVVDKGRAHWHPIHPGIANDHWVQVKSGLQADDVVVTTGRTSLTEGMAVHQAGKAGSQP